MRVDRVGQEAAQAGLAIAGRLGIATTDSERDLNTFTAACRALLHFLSFDVLMEVIGSMPDVCGFIRIYLRHPDDHGFSQHEISRTVYLLLGYFDGTPRAMLMYAMGNERPHAIVHAIGLSANQAMCYIGSQNPLVLALDMRELADVFISEISSNGVELLPVVEQLG